MMTKRGKGKIGALDRIDIRYFLIRPPSSRAPAEPFSRNPYHYREREECRTLRDD